MLLTGWSGVCHLQTAYFSLHLGLNCALFSLDITKVSRNVRLHVAVDNGNMNAILLAKNYQLRNLFSLKDSMRTCFLFPGLDDLRSSVVVLGSVFALSPALKTLTDSISTDTIYAMTVSTSKISVIIKK